MPTLNQVIKLGIRHWLEDFDKDTPWSPTPMSPQWLQKETAILWLSHKMTIPSDLLPSHEPWVPPDTPTLSNPKAREYHAVINRTATFAIATNIRDPT